MDEKLMSTYASSRQSDKKEEENLALPPGIRLAGFLLLSLLLIVFISACSSRPIKETNNNTFIHYRNPRL